MLSIASVVSDGSLSGDTAFDLLSSSRRRFVLTYLRDEPEPVALTEIAAAMAAAENDIPRAELDSQQRKRAYVSLYQTHIPRLEEDSVVTYDPDTGEVALQPAADELLRYIDATSGPPDGQWPTLYLLLAVLATGIYVLTISGIISVPLRVVGLVALTGLLFVSSTHWILVR